MIQEILKLYLDLKQHVPVEMWSNHRASGVRKLGIIHARLRHNCSVLNYDLFRCNLVGDPSCMCGNPCENIFHFFTECPLYMQARDTLYKNNDTAVTGNVNLNTFLYGNPAVSLDDNNIIFRAVQRYIRESGRF